MKTESKTIKHMQGSHEKQARLRKTEHNGWKLSTTNRSKRNPWASYKAIENVRGKATKPREMIMRNYTSAVRNTKGNHLQTNKPKGSHELRGNLLIISGNHKKTKINLRRWNRPSTSKTIVITRLWGNEQQTSWQVLGSQLIWYTNL